MEGSGAILAYALHLVPPTPPLARVQLQGCLEPWELNVQDLAKALPGHLGQPWMSEQGGSLFPDGSCSQTKNSQ